MRIGMRQATEMLMGLPTLVAYPDIIDALQPQPFLPNRDSQPHRPLIIFKSVPTDPGGAPGELNGIENDKHITKACPTKISGKRSKIWPAGGKDHGFTHGWC